MFTAGGCTEGSIRPAEGETPRQGRIEVCHGGIWGSVCKEGDSEWLDTDADAVCRQLGFQEPDETGDHYVYTLFKPFFVPSGSTL